MWLAPVAGNARSSGCLTPQWCRPVQSLVMARDPATIDFEPSQQGKLPPEVQSLIVQSRLGIAQARHAAHRAEIAAIDGHTWASAQSVIRLLMAVNAGALVAILAFLGSMIQAKAELSIGPLVAAMCLFLIGTGLSLAAGFIGFFAGSALSESLSADEIIYEDPYVVGTKASTAKNDDYNRYRFAGIGVTIASALAALCGSVSFLVFAIKALS